MIFSIIFDLALSKIDIVICPMEKLSVIIKSFKQIVNILELSAHKGQVASADDSLPCLIYVLLLAAPPRLHSNLK